MRTERKRGIIRFSSEGILEMVQLKGQEEDQRQILIMKAITGVSAVTTKYTVTQHQV